MISPSDLYAGDIVITSVPEPWHLAVVLRCEGDTVFLSGRDIVDDNSQPQCFCAKEEDIVPFRYQISPLKKLFHKDGTLDDVVYLRDTIITITQLFEARTIFSKVKTVSPKRGMSLEGKAYTIYLGA